jgi:serine/threonine protein kinase
MSLCINPQCSKPDNSDRMLFCQGCGSGLLLADKYRVTKLMSNKGGFGNTYEIVENQVPKVLKVLKNDNPKAIELFEREYRVLSDLTEDGIIGIPHVEDLFLYKPNESEQSLHCLVMERIYGMDLEEYVKAIKRPIDERTAIGWLSQLTQILQEIHSRDIFHRDIKPSNIILQPDGQLVLIDFGAVKEAVPNIHGQVTCIYTPGYAAPEQQKPGKASAQSDFYSLGRTFVYLLTEKEPLDLYDAYQDLLVWRDQTKNISGSCLNLIDRLMQETPDQRPNSTATIFREIATIPAPTTRQGTGYSRQPIANPNPPGNPSIEPLPTIASPLPIVEPPQSTPPIKSPNPIFAMVSKNWIPALIGLGILAIIIAKCTPNNGANNGIEANNSGGVFTDIQDVPNGVFKFGGSTTWATTRQPEVSMDNVIKGKFPQYNIGYTDANSPSANIRSISNGKCDKKPGSNTGLCWLIEGDLDFAQSSVSLAKSKYASQVDRYQLKEEAVGYDALTVVVNPQLKIPGLTVEQLRDIYIGKITNWNRVGGPNLLIVALSRAESSGGTVSSFKDLVLKKGDELKSTIVANTTEGLGKVIKNPGGIYYGAAKEVIVDSCSTQPISIGNTANSLVKPYQEPLHSIDDCRNGNRNKINAEVINNQEYPLTRKIYVIVKADGTDRQKAGEAYAKLLKTKQGQELLEKAGFVSIHN